MGRGPAIIIRLLIAVPFTVMAMPVTVVISTFAPAIVPVPLVIIVVIGKSRHHCHGNDHRGEGERQHGTADYRLEIPSLCC